MESIKIYESSHDELVRIRKSIGSDSVSINFTELDTETKGQLITAIDNVISKRSKELEKVILGVR